MSHGLLEPAREHVAVMTISSPWGIRTLPQRCRPRRPPCRSRRVPRSAHEGVGTGIHCPNTTPVRNKNAAICLRDTCSAGR
jgi:hypothetical protein